LVEEVDSRGGLAILAHVDAPRSVCENLRQNELADLIASPALAGVEFTKAESLAAWFTDSDDDTDRAEAWRRRQADPQLKDRGLARLMSSDAHSSEVVGREGASRTLTRLRLDEPNFAALRNAIKLNPKARCRAEAILPAAYPRILRAVFSGGFLDGVSLDFTGNLNCLIGGRGSGKSTALLSIRAALGADVSSAEDIDDLERMPQRTTVTYIDNAGSERTAIRERGGDPVDRDSSPIRLRMADLGQDESGRLARGYKDEPLVLLAFLDDFIDRYDFDETEEDLVSKLAENQAEIAGTLGFETQIEKLEVEKARLEGSLKAAQEGNIEEIARWAQMLASHKLLLAKIDARLAEVLQAPGADVVADLDTLAAEFDVDLSRKPAVQFVDGDQGLRAQLSDFEAKRATIQGRATTETSVAAEGVQKALGAWRAEDEELETRLRAKRAELEEKGLKVQAGAVLKIANRLNEVKKLLADLRVKKINHERARKARAELLDQLHGNRDALFEARKATLKRIAAAANEFSDDLVIHVSYERCGIADLWVQWLSSKFGFKRPRVTRIAQLIDPRGFADQMLNAPDQLLALLDEGDPVFTSEAIDAVRSWSAAFELEVLLRSDRPRIEVQRRGSDARKDFDHLSAGQQRSVLLSLLLCAERSEPLVLDQPGDHLDGQYIAGAVVRHLEAAKERRQIILATHSPNLVVLGDAELVIPLRVSDSHGKPYAVGAVDRRETTEEVCALLEGGEQAYKRRGERYGFRFDEGS
jgi:predicted ATPase